MPLICTKPGEMMEHGPGKNNSILGVDHFFLNISRNNMLK